MLSTLKESAYFARQHIQPLMTIAVLLTLPIWLIDYALPTPTAEEEVGIEPLVAGLVFTCLGVIQFAAAILYIHHQVLRQPIGALQAIALGASRIGPLLLINLLMALAIGLGLLLLILPGLYIAYKLLFGEFFLLLHGQRSLQALRSSYRANTLLSNKLLPPLLVWISCVAGTAIGSELLSPDAAPGLPISILVEAVNLLLTIWGWALLYRLYQRYIAPSTTRPDAAVGGDTEPKPVIEPESQPDNSQQQDPNNNG